MQEVKTIAIDYGKKVEQLNKNLIKKKTSPKQRVKSKSPVTINSARASKKFFLQNVKMKPKIKSPSPKKVSPSQKPVL